MINNTLLKSKKMEKNNNLNNYKKNIQDFNDIIQFKIINDTWLNNLKLDIDLISNLTKEDQLNNTNIEKINLYNNEYIFNIFKRKSRQININDLYKIWNKLLNFNFKLESDNLLKNNIKDINELKEIFNLDNSWLKKLIKIKNKYNININLLLNNILSYKLEWNVIRENKDFLLDEVLKIIKNSFFENQQKVNNKFFNQNILIYNSYYIKDGKISFWNKEINDKFKKYLIEIKK